MRINVGGMTVEVDGRAELEVFEWKKAQWIPNEEDPQRLVACSPFREDSNPSFYVYLKDTETAPAGVWGDSGGVGIYRRGGFVQLLAFLREETIEETEEYLLQKYAREWTGDTSTMSIDARIDLFTEKSRKKPLNPSILETLAFRHPYLESRGISEKVQRALKIGYDRKRQAISIPWFDHRGNLANIKYRSVNGKMFWFHPGGWPIRELVYGLHLIYRYNIREAVICEAEIDAMWCMTNGIPAIAVGGSKLSEVKRDLIIRSPLERLKIATDNDQAGEELREKIKEELGAYLALLDVNIPKEYKDLNEIRDGERLKTYVNNATLARHENVITWSLVKLMS
jgi:5S rRNA maturation endonuclease (ribonuclease M5)